MARNAAAKVATKGKPASRAIATADTALRISAADFVAWQDSLGLSNVAAARMLYAGQNQITLYRASGAAPDVALRCMAVLAGLRADSGADRARLLGRINAALDVPS